MKLNIFKFLVQNTGINTGRQVFLQICNYLILITTLRNGCTQHSEHIKNNEQINNSNFVTKELNVPPALATFSICLLSSSYLPVFS